MLKIKITRSKLFDSTRHYAEEGRGVTPVIVNDDDLIGWAMWAIGEACGIAQDEPLFIGPSQEPGYYTVTLDDKYVDEFIDNFSQGGQDAK